MVLCPARRGKFSRICSCSGVKPDLSRERLRLRQLLSLQLSNWAALLLRTCPCFHPGRYLVFCAASINGAPVPAASQTEALLLCLCPSLGLQPCPEPLSAPWTLLPTSWPGLCSPPLDFPLLGCPQLPEELLSPSHVSTAGLATAQRLSTCGRDCPVFEG